MSNNPKRRKVEPIVDFTKKENEMDRDQSIQKFFQSFSAMPKNEPVTIKPIALNPVGEPENKKDERVEKPLVKPVRQSKAQKELEQLEKKQKERLYASQLASGYDEEFNAELDKLSPTQREIFENVVYHNKSVFITGPGGVGKSFLIHLIKKAWIKCKREFWLTATTGVAAVNLGGTTIHSASGLGVPQGDAPTIVSKMNTFAKKNWKAVQSIIIDEVSMLDPEYLDLLDQVGRLVRGRMDFNLAVEKGNTKSKTQTTKQVENPQEYPFGGIQLIFCGDFFQLPPIHKDLAQKRKNPNFCEFVFQMPLWNIPREPDLLMDPTPKTYSLQDILTQDKKPPVVTRGYFHSIVGLHEPFRQSDSADFTLLNHVRFGITTPEDIARLESRMVARGATPQGMETGISPTRLYPRNDGVDNVNEYEYSKLSSGSTRTYQGTTGFTHEFDEENKYKDEDNTDIKKPVVPIKEKAESQKSFAVPNTSWEYEAEKLVKNCPVPRQMELRTGTQVMLTANVDVSRGLVNGSRGVVVGFSTVFPFHPLVSFLGATRADPKKKKRKQYEEYGTNVEEIEFFTWKSPIGTPVINGVACKGYAYFKQIPLKAAWAISVHKSQSITLDNVEISLGDDVFAYGQAYVALSRCRSIQGLVLSQFTPKSIRSHPETLKYYIRLENEYQVKHPGKRGAFVPPEIYPIIEKLGQL